MRGTSGPAKSASTANLSVGCTTLLRPMTFWTSPVAVTTGEVQNVLRLSRARN